MLQGPPVGVGQVRGGGPAALEPQQVEQLEGARLVSILVPDWALYC